MQQLSFLPSLIGMLCLTGASFWCTGCSDNQQPQQGNEQQLTADQTTSPEAIPYVDKTVDGDSSVCVDCNGSEKGVTIVYPIRATFTQAHKDTLVKALGIADTVIADPLFREIILSLAKDDAVDWVMNKMHDIPEAHRNKATEYIMEEFAKKGLHKIDEFKAYKWADGSRTTGPCDCGKPIRVNVNKLGRPIADIAATIVHERVHYFCQNHFTTQSECTQCDMAYITGATTFIIYEYRKGGSKTLPYDSSRMCEALRKKLVTLKIMKPDPTPAVSTRHGLALRKAASA